MTREIKFRAWVKTAPNKPNRMIQVRRLDFAFNSITDNDTGNAHSLIGSVLMQYTRLKDKDGTEIYEGDIVHVVEVDYRGLSEWQSAIEWVGNGWYVTDPEDTQCPLDAFVGDGIGSLNEIEIIGNIYEKRGE